MSNLICGGRDWLLSSGGRHGEKSLGWQTKMVEMG